MMVRIRATLMLTAIMANPVCAATLRPFGQLSGPTVAVSDLWDDAGPTAAVTLGPGPAPGERIVVESAQLVAIAHQFGVDWHPGDGVARSVLQRPGAPLPLSTVVAALRDALATASGAGDATLEATDTAIELADFTPPLVDPSRPVTVTVEHCSQSAAGGRFEARLAVTGPAMTPLLLQVSGEVVVQVGALVATRRLTMGWELRPADMAPARIRRDRVRGALATAPEQVAGLILKHGLAQGEPLLLSEMAPPLAVVKGARISVVIVSGGIAVSASAEALQGGAIGERITVRNPASRAVLLAEITGPNAVRVEPGSTPVQRPAASVAP
jgi:flagella basal body P-ring formation protein FlgA